MSLLRPFPPTPAQQSPPQVADCLAAFERSSCVLQWRLSPWWHVLRCSWSSCPSAAEAEVNMHDAGLWCGDFIYLFLGQGLFNGRCCLNVDIMTGSRLPLSSKGAVTWPVGRGIGFFLHSVMQPAWLITKKEAEQLNGSLFAARLPSITKLLYPQLSDFSTKYILLADILGVIKPFERFLGWVTAGRGLPVGNDCLKTDSR